MEKKTVTVGGKVMEFTDLDEELKPTPEESEKLMQVANLLKMQDIMEENKNEDVEIEDDCGDLAALWK